MNIFVEKQTDQSDTIEVIYYQTPVVALGREVTELMPLPQINLSSTLMTIRNPEQVEINFTAFKNEFPFTQFTGEKWWNEDINLGEQVILIRIPKGLELKVGPDLFVEYVGSANE